jgi:uncharacterized protein (DUF608 family)
VADAWDANGDGVLDVPLHNTYDIEFYGEEPLGQVYFLAALRAAAELAGALGLEQAEEFATRADAAATATDAALFNGEYFEQRLPDSDAHRYQYGTGVLSDQVLGQLHAHTTGLGHLLPREHVRSAIAAVYRYNFRRDLTGHESTQRTFALEGEGGLLLCSWPRGGRPAIPFVYSDEVWTGTEYQVAAQLVYEGLVAEGLEVVRTARDRFDGVARSPWNDTECGNHYARSLASWALLLAFSGAQWNARERSLAFAPAQDGPFRSFFSTGTAWGRVEIDDDAVVISVEHGTLDVASLTVRQRRLHADRSGPVGAGQSIRFTAHDNPKEQS